MMITPISHYDAKRKKPPIEREPSGRRKRNVSVEFVVYVIGLPAFNAVKIGRTQNIDARLARYKNQLKTTPVCVAQFVVGSREDAKQLERDCIAYMKANSPAIKREWFQVTFDALPEKVDGMKAAATVPILNTFDRAADKIGYLPHLGELAEIRRRSAFGHNGPLYKRWF